MLNISFGVYAISLLAYECKYSIDVKTLKIMLDVTK